LLTVGNSIATERLGSWLFTNESFGTEMYKYNFERLKQGFRNFGKRQFGAINFKVYQNISHNRILDLVIQ
jgi:hypothetical protein